MTTDDAPPPEMDCSPECLGRMAVPGTDRKPDFTVTGVRIKGAWERDGESGFILGWETQSAGFGELTVWQKADGTFGCDTECMGKEFVKAVFAKLADNLPEGK